jgi:hypothetical protein
VLRFRALLLIFVNLAYRAGYAVVRVLFYYGVTAQIHCLPGADTQDWITNTPGVQYRVKPQQSGLLCAHRHH